MEGQDDETRVFRFMTGAQSVRNEKLIGTEYVSGTQEIAIKKPFISVGVALDGDSELMEYVGSFNDPIRVEVSYFNNLTAPILDAEIHIKLSGSAFDKSAVSPEQGLYKSATNEIVWNTITTPNLKSIAAGDTGKVSFSVTPKDLSSLSKAITNPDIGIAISVRGKRISETDVPESVTSSAQRRIKISSNIALGGQIIRSNSPFANFGPIPPRAEQQTSYTVVWTVDNTSSNINNTQVTASLPPYVKWLGKVSPTDEDISYNSVDGTLVWRVGSLGTYTLNNSRRRQVAFQIGFTPSIKQVGQSPVLINDATLTGQDDFTNEPLNSTLSALTTRFSTDQSFNDGDEQVRQ